MNDRLRPRRVAGGRGSRGCESCWRLAHEVVGVGAELHVYSDNAGVQLGLRVVMKVTSEKTIMCVCQIPSSSSFELFRSVDI